jgi:predicted oxidoreductase
MGYIVDLTVILHGIFRLATGNITPKCARQVLERHVSSGHKDLTHRDIESFKAEAFATRFSTPQNDLVLEKIIGLIKQNCVPPSEIEVEVE